MAIEATDNQLLNVEGDWGNKSSNKKDWTNDGNLEKPGPVFPSGQREHYLIWKRRLSEEQADKPRVWRGELLMWCSVYTQAAVQSKT